MHQVISLSSLLSVAHLVGLALAVGAATVKVILLLSATPILRSYLSI